MVLQSQNAQEAQRLTLRGGVLHRVDLIDIAGDWLVSSPMDIRERRDGTVVLWNYWRSILLTVDTSLALKSRTVIQGTSSRIPEFIGVSPVGPISQSRPSEFVQMRIPGRALSSFYQHDWHGDTVRTIVHLPGRDVIPRFTAQGTQPTRRPFTTTGSTTVTDDWLVHVVGEEPVVRFVPLRGGDRHIVHLDAAQRPVTPSMLEAQIVGDSVRYYRYHTKDDWLAYTRWVRNNHARLAPSLDRVLASEDGSVYVRQYTDPRPGSSETWFVLGPSTEQIGMVLFAPGFRAVQFRGGMALGWFDAAQSERVGAVALRVNDARSRP